ncbi:MAG: hypothetical protein JXB49_06340, partial [Bacteroidales bacterium]|nr:hypothetical protein [Bacteroidales bacterium]
MDNFRLFFILILTLVLLRCGNNSSPINNDITEQETTNKHEQVINSSGGKIDFDSSNLCYFPESSVKLPTLIKVENTIVNDSSDSNKILNVFEGEPSGTSFEEPVLVVIPIDKKLSPGTIVKIQSLNDSTNTLQPYYYMDSIEAYGIAIRNGDQIAFLINHFSKYFISKLTYDYTYYLTPIQLDHLDDGTKMILPKDQDPEKMKNSKFVDISGFMNLNNYSFRKRRYFEIMKNMVLQPDNPFLNNVGEKIHNFLKIEGVVESIIKDGSRGYINHEIVESILADNYSYNLKLSGNLNLLSSYLSKISNGLEFIAIIEEPVRNAISLFCLNEIQMSLAIERCKTIRKIMDDKLSLNNVHIETLKKDEAFCDALMDVETYFTNAQKSNSELILQSFNVINEALSFDLVNDVANKIVGISSLKLLTKWCPGLPVAITCYMLEDAYENAEEHHIACIDRALQCNLDYQLFKIKQEVIDGILNGDYSSIPYEFQPDYYSIINMKYYNSYSYLNSKYNDLIGNNKLYLTDSFEYIWKNVKNLLFYDICEQMETYYTKLIADIKSDYVKINFYSPPIVNPSVFVNQNISIHDETINGSGIGFTPFGNIEISLKNLASEKVVSFNKTADNKGNLTFNYKINASMEAGRWFYYGTDQTSQIKSNETEFNINRLEPVTPTDLSLTDITGGFSISWTNVTGATGYKIFWGTTDAVDE